MDFTKLSQFLNTGITLSAPIIAILTIIFFARGKRSILTNYIWKLLFKKEMAISDKEFSDHIKEKMDLEKLRLHYPGLTFHNTKHAKGLLAWSEINNVGMDEISKYSEGFIYDRNRPENINFYLPQGLGSAQAIAIIFSIISSGLLIVILWATPFSGFGDSILAKTKISDSWFLINKDNSISNTIFSEEWKANSNNCHQTLTDKKFTETESNALCELITKDGNNALYFEKAKKETKITLWILLPILTLGFIYFMKENKRIIAFKKLHKYINSNSK